jgi:tRNA(Ile)-lysidine synthase
VLSADYILHILKTQCGYADGETVLVGVSGGADSVALLHLLHAAEVPVAAAHVNYGLRGNESERDEQFVAELCRTLKIPFYLRKSSRDELNSIANNLQNAGRSVRYTFFREIIAKEAMRYIAVAHHQDDQLETFLINFLRGAGVAGLSGMDFIDRYDLQLIRPLLDTSRADIENYLQQNAIAWRNDSSNATDDFLRNRIRHSVIPALHAVDERHSKGWKNSVAQLKNSHALNESIIRSLLRTDSSVNGLSVRIPKEDVLAYANAHLIFNSILHHVGFHLNFSEEAFSGFTALQTGRKFFSGNMQLIVDREEWIIAENSTALRAGFSLVRGEELHGWHCEEITVDDPVNYSGMEAVLAVDADASIDVRVWKHGDGMQPLGFRGTKKVSDILTELKVPSDEKANYPLLTINGEVAWIPGYRVAEKYKVTSATKTALHIKWNR